MIDGLDDATASWLHAALDRTARRSAVVASNLANVDTPGYRAMDVDFGPPPAPAGSLEVARTEAGHLGGAPGRAAPGRIIPAPADRLRADGSTVDVDREMTLLAALQGRYQEAAEMIRKRFALLVYAATDGRIQS